MDERTPKATTTIVASLLVLLVLLGVCASAPAADARPTLDPALAARLMRHALAGNFSFAWSQGKARHVACPVRVPAPRPEGEFANTRRRCWFHWRAGRERFKGRGMVWMNRWHGELYWFFTFRARRTIGARVKDFGQSGNVGTVAVFTAPAGSA